MRSRVLGATVILGVVLACAPGAAARPAGARKITFSTALVGAAWIADVATDRHGNVYVTGTAGGPSFPATKGAFQREVKGVLDAFVAKYAPSGRLVFATLLGGGSDELDQNGEDAGQAVAVDRAGNVYVSGRTTSETFPTKHAFQPEGGGPDADAFVTKLSPDGSSLEWSTYLGGLQLEGNAGLELGADGSVWIAGTTDSPDFPMTGDAFQPEFAGAWDGYVARFDRSGSLTYSTFLGGAGYDNIRGLAVADGRPYVTGNTETDSDAPERAYPTTSDAFMEKPDTSGIDAFVTKLAADGRRLVYSTFLGGRGPKGYPVYDEEAGGIAVDARGRAVVSGSTESRTFPTKHAFQKRIGGLLDAYVTKLTRDGSGLVYSSYYGGASSEVVNAVDVDARGRAHVAGRTNSSVLPRRWALQNVAEGYWDAFVASFSTRGRLAFATYLGAERSRDGTSEEEELLAVEARRGDVYVGGYAAGEWPVVGPSGRKTSRSEAVITRLTPLVNAPVHRTRLTMRLTKDRDEDLVHLRGRVRVADGFGACRSGRGVTAQVENDVHRWYSSHTYPAERGGRYHLATSYVPTRYRALASSTVERVRGRWHACTAAISRARSAPR